VEAVVEVGCRERAPVQGVRYFSFVDPSGGSSDSMTLAIAHRDKDLAVLDCVRERRAPFSPEAVVKEFAATLRSYGVTAIRGDRYAGEWPREAFRKHGVDYLPAAMSKSEIYLAFLPLVNSSRAVLLDDQRMINQLCALERRTARGGRDSIDHPPGAHDDVANAAAGAVVLAGGRERELIVSPLVGVVSSGSLGDHPQLPVPSGMADVGLLPAARPHPADALALTVRESSIDGLGRMLDGGSFGGNSMPWLPG
jgi:hypothetical protein